MSRNDGTDHTHRPLRPRSNTFWRRTRTGTITTNDPSPPTKPLSIAELIVALSPQYVPSLDHARSLSNALAVASPLPPLESIHPILAHLCHSERPPNVQAAGYDILSAYFENNEAPPLKTGERHSVFAVFLGSSVPWSSELWEPRFKALRVFTKYGTDTIGIETAFLNLLKAWAEEAFDELFVSDDNKSISGVHGAGGGNNGRTEKERCVDVVASFLTDSLSGDDSYLVKRLPEEQFFGVFAFFARLVDKAIESPETDITVLEESHTSTSTSTVRVLSHKRNPSSLSISTLNSLGNASLALSRSSPAPKKHPADVATLLYLNHLSKHLSTLPGERYADILPVLLRAFAFYASPLPRLNVMSQPHRTQTMEDRLSVLLNSLLAGSFSSTCMRVLKKQLRPNITSDSTVNSAIQVSTGAYRTLRLHIRNSLQSRMARAYIAREVTYGYSPSGAPSHMEIESDIMSRAWSKDDVGGASSGWGAGKLKRAMCISVEEWVGYCLNMDSPERKAGKERILEEAVGILKDVFQELDMREEIPSALDEDEAETVGSVLYRLAAYILPLKNPDGTPFIVPLDHPNNAPTPFLRSLSTLLSRDHSTFLIPLLSTTLLYISDHLTDTHTSKIPLAMSEQNELIPLSTDWLQNWTLLLKTSASPGRAVTRAAVNQTLKAVYESVKDMPSYRRPLAGVVYEFCKKLAGVGVAGNAVSVPDEEDHEAPWFLIADEISTRAGERHLEDQCPRAHEREEEEGGEERDEDEGIKAYLDLMRRVISEVRGEREEDDSTTPAGDPDSMSVNIAEGGASAVGGLQSLLVTPSTVLSRMGNVPDSSSLTNKDKDKEKETMPSVLSLLSSLAQSANSSPNPSSSSKIPASLPVPPPTSPPAIHHPHHHQQQESDTSATMTSPPLSRESHSPGTSGHLSSMSTGMTRSVCVAMALIRTFSHIAFTPLSLDERNVGLALKVWAGLLEVLRGHHVPARARLVVLQFMMRLRADRDHRMYFLERGFDTDGHVRSLSELVNRCGPGVVDKDKEREKDRERAGGGGGEKEKAGLERMDSRRDGRRVSRGRPARPSEPVSSRSRSRVPNPTAANTTSTTPKEQKPRETLWAYPDVLPFHVKEGDKPSEGLVTYDARALGPTTSSTAAAARIILPISDYVDVLIALIEKESNWEILSYILCFFPAQLANKHLFCGPDSRKAIEALTKKLCAGIVQHDLAKSVERWPAGLKSRDAYGLAYHTLSVLVSYKRCLDNNMRNTLVEVLQEGLHGSKESSKACLRALSLLAFEYPNVMTKNMTRILESLSTIMSTAEVASHILAFLAIVGSLPALRANFTEAEYKMVFSVALQYLQHHNRADDSGSTSSWALSQYVRIVCYYVVYTWFLALRLPDRPKHVQYIIRQLLVANEGRQEVDEPTEVCFDWLARYTYASADPRPANSILSEVIMAQDLQEKKDSGPPGSGGGGGGGAIQHGASSSTRTVAEKTWILGNSVVTVRTTSRTGWVEVLSRRPSGFTKVLCHVENVPLVGPGEINPDFVSGVAGLIINRAPPTLLYPDEEDPRPPTDYEQLLMSKEPSGDDPPKPNPITGYVWSGTAPSQRRKEVCLDPSFLALQFSPYPTTLGSKQTQTLVPQEAIGSFLRALDRMPVIDTHKVAIMYVAPGQTREADILANIHGSPAYTRFLEGIGRLIYLRGQVDVYAGGLDPDEDGEYAYAWWNDIGQILYHTATMMPRHAHDPLSTLKKRHLGNDYVRIVWNDSGLPYAFDTLQTQFQFINIVIEPHSLGAVSAFSNNIHENEYFKVTVQTAPGMSDFSPLGDFKIISADNLSLLVRQISLFADWYASIYVATNNDTQPIDVPTNWRSRLQAIRRFKDKQKQAQPQETSGGRGDGILAQEAFRDFTSAF